MQAATLPRRVEKGSVVRSCQRSPAEFLDVAAERQRGTRQVVTEEGSLACSEGKDCDMEKL